METNSLPVHIKLIVQLYMRIYWTSLSATPFMGIFRGKESNIYYIGKLYIVILRRAPPKHCKKCGSIWHVDCSDTVIGQSE